MLATMARGLYFGFLAVMLLAWALNSGKPEVVAQPAQSQVYYIFT